MRNTNRMSILNTVDLDLDHTSFVSAVTLLLSEAKHIHKSQSFLLYSRTKRKYVNTFTEFRLDLRYLLLVDQVRKMCQILSFMSRVLWSPPPIARHDVGPLTSKVDLKWNALAGQKICDSASTVCCLHAFRSNIPYWSSLFLFLALSADLHTGRLDRTGLKFILEVEL